MSSTGAPLWFCHQCHAEMRPLMTPDPICAACRGSFVEKLENPADDPRNYQHPPTNMFDTHDDIPGAFEGFLRSGPWISPQGTPRPRSPPIHRSQDNASTSTGLRFEFHSRPGGSSTRTFILGGSNPHSRSPSQPDRPVPTIFEFLRRDPDNPNTTRNPGGIDGPLMAQYFMAMFGRDLHTRGDPLAEFMGMPPSGQWGDYIFNQEALDQILAQLAENSTAGRPVPATEDIIHDLSKEVLTEGSPLLERDCAVCKESFQLYPEDPDELVVVTLPCKHPFHESCILPWLKSSGTCPVCRFALIAQPQQHSPGGPSGGSSSSNRTNPSSGPHPRSPGSPDRGSSGGGSIFHALFGGGAGASSGHHDTYSARSQHNLGSRSRNLHPEAVSHSSPSFPGQWIEDID